ncbi:MAG: tetratricopeptide repeat protein, partial [Deltaproteobacteria bacterium]
LAGCASVQTPNGLIKPEAARNPAGDAPQSKPRSEKEKKNAAAFNVWLKTIRENPKEALNAHKDIAVSMPDRWQVNYNAAVIYMKLNEPDKAESELNAALKKNPRPGMVYGALGVAYALAGKKDDAAAAFKKAFKEDSRAAVLINAGGVYLEMGRYEEAMTYYRDAETIEPENPLVRYNLGLLLYRKGDYKKALEEFRKAKRAGDGITASLCEAQTLLKLGRHEDALELFKNAVEKDTNYFYLYKHMGIIYELYAGDMKKAYEYYNMYLSMVKSDKDVESWIQIVKTRLAREGQ